MVRDTPTRFLGVIPYTWSLTEVLILGSAMGTAILAAVGLLLWAIGPVPITPAAVTAAGALSMFLALIWLRRWDHDE